LRRFQLRGQRVARAGLDVRVSKPAAEGAPHRLDVLRRRGLVQRDAERALADAEIDFHSPRTGDDFALRCAGNTVTVSKNASDCGTNPSLRNPAASTAVRR